MKKYQKHLAVLLAFTLIFALIAACSDGGEADRGEPIDLTIYSQLANFSGLMGGWAGEIMLDKFNVRFNIINDGVDGTFQTRMEAGFLGDIILFGDDSDEYREASAAGLLFDWEEDHLIWNHGEYIADHFMHALNKNKAITGTLHGFGHGVAGSAGDHAAFYYYPHVRFDLYQKLGSPPIGTLEDFIPVLADMVALEPLTNVGTRTYAVSSFSDWDGDMVMMVKSTAALYGWEEFHIGLYCTQTQDWQGALHEGGWYIRCLKFYNKLHQLGLFDPDSMTQTWDDITDKYLNGAAMFNIFSWIADTFNVENNINAGKMMRPVAAADQVNLADGLSVYGGNRVWAIGANSNYPELCMDIINWLATPEGVLSYLYGPQGVTWDYDEDGEAYLTELGLQIQDDAETVLTYKNYTGSHRMGTFEHNNTTWASDAINPESPSGLSFNWRFWPSSELARVVAPIEQEWRDWSGFVQEDDYIRDNGYSVAIASAYTGSSKNRELRTIWEQVTLTIKEGSWNAIYASSDAEFDSIVDQMITNAYAFGYDQCVEWMLVEVERRKEAEAAVS
ncbi:MAG: hypothetical protein LBD23_07710 [Oscillospiraceae bacterium]|jgi:multiple sugar transport system substrate-binding protein/putative aldouronate transport system substrate-binding protein|nr:hypothetical protein [Oscillospiraceae bacterium]